MGARPSPDLPVELVQLIIDHLQQGLARDAQKLDYEERPKAQRLARYASITPTWKAAIERVTFRDLSLTRARLDDFAKFVIGARRPCVRSINFDMLLDEYDVDLFQCVETAEEQVRNDEVFVEATTHLIRVLAEWPATSTTDLRILISAWSPSDISRDKHRDHRRRLQGIEFEDIEEKRYHRNHVRYYPDAREQALVIPAVASLEFPQKKSRNLWPSSVVALASHFPRLTRLTGGMQDVERRDVKRRRAIRQVIADNLAALDVGPKGVREVSLDLGSRSPFHETFALHSMIPAGLSTDPLSWALGELSHSLIRFELTRAVLNIEDFFALSSDTQWPHLKTIELHLTPMTASGQFYFNFPTDFDWDDPAVETLREAREYPPHEEAPDEMDIVGGPGIRLAPDDEQVRNLYLSASAAASRMPLLQYMRLELETMCPGTVYYRFHHFEYRTHKSFAGGFNNCGVAQWTSRPLYCPDEEVKKAWGRIGGPNKESRAEVASNNRTVDPDLADYEPTTKLQVWLETQSQHPELVAIYGYPQGSSKDIANTHPKSLNRNCACTSGASLHSHVLESDIP